MPCYAALVSLLHTIARLLNSSQISLDSHSTEILTWAATELYNSLEPVFSTLSDQFKMNITGHSSESMHVLDGYISHALRNLEDIIESNVSKELLRLQSEQSVRDHPLLYSISLPDIEKDIRRLTEVVKKMTEEYFGKLHLLLSDQERKDQDEDIAVSSGITSGGPEPKMVGLSDRQGELKYKLTRDEEKQLTVSVVGMAGIGKTTLAKKVFEDPNIVSHFDCRAWVTVGKHCQFGKILQVILAQVAPERTKPAFLTGRFESKTQHLKASFKKSLQHILPNVNRDGDQMLAPNAQPEASLKKTVEGILAHVNLDGNKRMLAEGYQKIARYSKASWNKILIRSLTQKLQNSLECRRYLIVLDDVWHKSDLEKVVGLLPKDNNGSKVLLTTRLRLLGGSELLNMRLMNENESWNLFCEKLFAKHSCPPDLEGAGKKIIERCEGLPLTIVTVANLLSKDKKTSEYWSEVATQKKHQLFIEAYNEISKILYPSYDSLPQFFREHFLYMGVFPQNYEIPQSKLINLWSADGVLFDDDEDVLKVLIDWNLLMPCEESISNFDFALSYQTKTCQLHSSMWHLCNREAKKNKFSHILNDRADGLEEGINSQRRLCIHNNILFGIKDVYNSIDTKCASIARCLLCFGPYHQYPVPICSNLCLLRVLDALTIRLYEFPVQVLKLVLLRYLALTYNGKLPASISKLCNLQFFIVRQHLSIKPCGSPSYLPLQIWHMKDLLHLQIMGRDLPNPSGGASLPNLLVLSDVSPHSCTENVFKAIPKLEKLGIRIELAPNRTKPLSCFDHISNLHELESLKCVIVNPEQRSEVVAPLVPLSNFPLGLRKLTLSGLGYPWEETNKIASLPNLEVLKLRCYAFRGPKWEVEKRGFKNLRFLLIEDTDFVQWKVGRESFRNLEYLSLKHCYKLEEIYGESDIYPDYKLEVVDCNPLIITWAKKLKQAALEEYSKLEVRVYSSWIDREVNSRHNSQLSS